MAKGGLDLKTAIFNLRINQPYDLRSERQVPLKAPKVEALQKKVHQFEVPQNEDAQSEAPQIKHTQIDEASVLKVTENIEKSESHNSEHDQNEVTHNEIPQIEDTQTEVSQFKAPQNKVPQIDRAKNPSFFMLSHGIFSEPKIRELSGDAFRVFVWMSSQAWRYPDSNGVFRAAVSYASLGTGVSTASVSRCLQVLRDQQLIRLVETDFKRGNSWFVTDLALAKMPTRINPHQIEQPQNEVPQIDKGALSKRGSSSINLREELYQNDVEERKSTTLQEIPKNSLSAKIESAVIRKYLEELKSVRKRVSEKKAFEELQDFHPEEHIEKALNYILKNGTPPKGDSCHSPMAFLAVAISDVLRVLQKQDEDGQRRQQKQAQRQASVEALTDKQNQEADADRQADKEAAFLEEDFSKIFPSEHQQQEELLKYIKLFPMMNPRGPVFRKLAIAAWRQNEKQKGSAECSIG